MSTVHRVNAYRVAGVLEAAYYLDGMTAELIADGCHLPPELLRYAVKFKGRERIALVTDSMRAAGMPEGVLCINHSCIAATRSRRTLASVGF